MFFAWTYALLFLSVIGLNHKFGKPHSEKTERAEKHRRRTHARLAKLEAEEREERAKQKQKRADARQKQREMDEQLHERRHGQRRFVYGVAPERYYEAK